MARDQWQPGFSLDEFARVGAKSLGTRLDFILSGPRDLFNGRDEITQHTSSLVTVLKEKRSSEGI